MSLKSLRKAETRQSTKDLLKSCVIPGVRPSHALVRRLGRRLKQKIPPRSNLTEIYDIYHKILVVHKHKHQCAEELEDIKTVAARCILEQFPDI